MAKDFTLVTSYNEGMPLKTLAKDSATVIEPGDMIGLTSGLAVKAGATTTALAWTPNGAPAGVTTIQVLNDKEAEFVGTGDAVFAVAQRGTEVDLVLGGSAQQVDVGSTATKVLKISVGTDAGTVGSASNIKVRINKFLY